MHNPLALLLRTYRLKQSSMWKISFSNIPVQTNLRNVNVSLVRNIPKTVSFSSSPWISPTEYKRSSTPHSSLFSIRPITRHERVFSTSASSSSLSSLNKFEDMENLHPNSKRAIEQMGLTHLTEIQANSFDAIVSGKDVLARARTGTGKTIAFLLPAIERILKKNQEQQSDNKSNKYHTPPPGLEILILSPTRELALQISEQAKALLSFHHGNNNNNKLVAQVVFGGSSKQQDFKSFNRQLPTILVATPGRLKDHLDSTWIPPSSSSSSEKSLSDCIRSNLQILIIDEMDRLLDMGFIEDIKNILSHLPPKMKRQTLLFSATVPPQLKSVLETTLKSDYVTIDCIQDLDPATHTNAQVDQAHVIVPARTKWISSTVETILYITLQSKLRIAKNVVDENNKTTTPYKIVAFFPTTNLVSYYADLFNFGLGIQVMELHSRKSQNYRTSVSNRFREVSQGILFTSDVSARGVDYPGVSHVIQFGISDGRETYIHRLGRTGRAGKRGRGLLVVTDVEGPAFLQSCLSDLDVAINKDCELESCILMDLVADDQAKQGHGDIDETQSSSIALAVKHEAKRLLDPVIQSVQSGKNNKLQKAAEDAYRSLLGFYTAKLPTIGIKSKHVLVNKVNAFALQAGLTEPPSISYKLAKTLGVDKMEGIRIMDENSVGRGRNDENQLKRNSFENFDSRVRNDKNRSFSVPNKTRRSPLYEEWGTRIPITKMPK